MARPFEVQIEGFDIKKSSDIIQISNPIRKSMPFNEKLADRIRESLSKVRGVTEKKMFGGVAFMVNDKMCVGVDKDDLILRCEPDVTDELLAKKGVRIFNLTGKPMTGWLLVGPEATSGKKDLDYWINLSLESNKKIKPSKKPK